MNEIVVPMSQFDGIVRVASLISVTIVLISRTTRMQSVSSGGPESDSYSVSAKYSPQNKEGSPRHAKAHVPGLCLLWLMPASPHQHLTAGIYGIHEDPEE